jgi:UMF1 family MFS transporter
VDNTKLFALYEFGESFLANGLGLVLFPILFYQFGINIYDYSFIIGVSNLIGVFINIFLLRTPLTVLNKLFLFSSLTFLVGFGLLTENEYLFALSFMLFTIVHMQALLFYQISILETKDPKISSSFSSILGYLGYFLAVVSMFFVKDKRMLIGFGIFVYITCAFLFYKYSNKNVLLKAQKLSIFKDNIFLKYTISLLFLSIAPQFFNNSMTMYLKTYLLLPDKKVYILMFIGLLFAIGSSFVLGVFWKKENAGFYITVFLWFIVYLLAIWRFFVRIDYPFFYGVILAVFGGMATGVFWTFFKAITVLKFNDDNVGIRISFIYGFSSGFGPILFFVMSFISPVIAFLSILVFLIISFFIYILFFGF